MRFNGLRNGFIGETDNFVSNGVIVKGLDFKKVVQHLMAYLR
ncbi:hypothetical protein [Helicobacter pylori]|nr:hypothetical protein [Helicobacter pylori]